MHSLPVLTCAYNVTPSLPIPAGNCVGVPLVSPQLLLGVSGPVERTWISNRWVLPMQPVLCSAQSQQASRGGQEEHGEYSFISKCTFGLVHDVCLLQTEEYRRSATETQKKLVEKFKFYYTRYENHLLSIKFECQLLQESRARATSLLHMGRTLSRKGE